MQIAGHALTFLVFVFYFQCADNVKGELLVAKLKDPACNPHFGQQCVHEAVTGQNISLTCTVSTDYDYCAGLEWYERGADGKWVFLTKKNPPVESRPPSVARNNSLTYVLEASHKKENVTLMCTTFSYGPRSQWQNKSAHIFIKVDDIEKPRLTKRPKEHIVVNSGEDTHIECAATAFPTPTIAFLKSNSIIKETGDGRIRVEYKYRPGTVIAKLLIKRFKSDDCAVYTCTVDDYGGTARISARTSVSETRKDFLSQYGTYLFGGIGGAIVLILLSVFTYKFAKRKKATLTGGLLENEEPPGVDTRIRGPNEQEALPHNVEYDGLLEESITEEVISTEPTDYATPVIDNATAIYNINQYGSTNIINFQMPPNDNNDSDANQSSVDSTDEPITPKLPIPCTDGSVFEPRLNNLKEDIDPSDVDHYPLFPGTLSTGPPEQRHIEEPRADEVDGDFEQSLNQPQPCLYQLKSPDINTCMDYDTSVVGDDTRPKSIVPHDPKQTEDVRTDEGETETKQLHSCNSRNVLSDHPQSGLYQLKGPDINTCMNYDPSLVVDDTRPKSIFTHDPKQTEDVRTDEDETEAKQLHAGKSPKTLSDSKRGCNQQKNAEDQRESHHEVYDSGDSDLTDLKRT